MTALSIRLSQPLHWRLPGFGRFVAFVATVLDVFVEAHEQARAAHARFPFADW